MGGLIGWLLLLPLIFAFWLTITIANSCARREKGSWRFLGVMSSLVIGGICIQVGYWFTEEGMAILGWINMVVGGIIALLGTWTALMGTKQKIEQREEIERLEKQREEEERNWVMSEAKKMLERGEIDDYEKLASIRRILWGRHEFILCYDLDDLKKKLTKKQKGKPQS